MKNLRSILSVICTLCLFGTVSVKAQKKIAELTLVYEYSVSSAAEQSKHQDGGANATNTIYIKGSKSRSEMSNSLFSSTTLFDLNTGSGVILREVSGQKLLINLTSENWQERNRVYDGMVYKNTTETRDIAGYKCIKAIATTKTGATLTVFYTRDVVPDNKDYDPVFKNLDGLPLEYELTNGDMKIRYKISKINFNPVPASKFDLPKSGYREMNYEESKKMNIGG